MGGKRWGGVERCWDWCGAVVFFWCRVCWSEESGMWVAGVYRLKGRTKNLTGCIFGCGMGWNLFWSFHF